MADTKTSDLTALTGANTATGDKIPIADVSATTLKTITVTELAAALQLLSGLYPIPLTPATGEYIGGQFHSAAIVTGTAVTLNRLYFMPIVIPRTQTYDRIAFYLQTVGSSGAVGRLGIYSPNATTGKPGALLVDAGTVVTDAGTGIKTITINQALTPGLYYLAFVGQVANCTPRTMTLSNGLAAPVGTSTFEGTFTTPGQNSYIQASVTGALPDPAVPVYTENPGTLYVTMGLRAA